MKKVAVIASLICIATFILSCGLGFKPTFIEPSFVYSNIEAGGIAILPVGASAGAQADIALRREAALGLEKKLAEKYPKVKITGIQTTTVKLSKGGLGEKYAKALETYQTTGVTDAATLETIGKAVGSRYLAMPVIQGYDKEKVERGHKYTIALEVQIWDVDEKLSVFQHVTKGKATPGIFTDAKAKDAAATAGEKASWYFPAVPKESK